MLLVSAMLAGCAGGPIAQQIASSIATRVADKMVGDAVDAQLKREREPRHIDIMNTEPDPYLAKFLTMQFPDPEPAQVVIEPLPEYVEIENGNSSITSGRLVSVEVLSLVMGQEKLNVFERSMQNGSKLLPAPMEWRDWQLAAGSVMGHSEKQLYFLVPPELGKVHSGDLAIVEIANVGGLHIARHRAN
jgi:hypothetical protein